MKELNKLIEGIAWPITYDGKSFRDKKCRVISETVIAHALNNLQPKGFICKGCDNRVPTEYSLRTEGYCYLCDPNITTKELLANNLQPKGTKWHWAKDKPIEPVSGERTGEEGERLLFDVISSIEQFGEVPDDLMRRAKEAVKYTS